ncbi:MAG: 50S ribosomal protein L29 [Christensenellales bacterium]
MKTKDIREMTTEELNTKLKDLKVELFNLRFSHATGSLANPMSLNTVKKDIAKVKTILKERELNKSVKGSK